MQVIFQITAGPSVGRKIRVHTDRITQCGKSVKADIGFPYDDAMSDLHFEIRFAEEGPLVRDMDSAKGTRVNGDALTSSRPLKDGDQIEAGQTRLLVKIDAAERTLPSAGGAVIAGIASAEPKINTALVFCKPLELTEEATKRLDDTIRTPEYVTLLAGAGLYDDAIKVLGLSLPHRLAVWWGWSCVRQSCGELLKPDDLIAFNAAYDWVADPSDPIRRAAMATAEHAKMQGPGSWMSVAAFWSGDSLSLPNLPKVPPAPTLCSQAVGVALTLAASLLPPAEAAKHQKAWIARGQALAKAPAVEWPKPARRDPDLPPSRDSSP